MLSVYILFHYKYNTSLVFFPKLLKPLFSKYNSQNSTSLVALTSHTVADTDIGLHVSAKMRRLETCCLFDLTHNGFIAMSLSFVDNMLRI
jgi:hypothetical protein